MFELRSGTVCVGCVLCGCVCARSISAQAFETGFFMFELSWSKACGCVAPCPNPSLTMELRSELMLYPKDAKDDADGD